MKAKKLFTSLSVLFTLALIIAAAAVMTGCGDEGPKTTPVPTPDRYYDDPIDDSVLDESAEPGIAADFTMVDLGDNVRIHTEAQAQYIEDTPDSYAKYTKPTRDDSACEKTVLSWEFSADEASEFKHYTVKLAERKDFSDAVEYSAKKKNSYDLYNLKAGTTYYWRVYAVYADQTYRSQVKSFTTEAAAPRNLFIGGVENVRDIGGWITEDGGTIRQGLVFRTARLNENASSSSNLKGNAKQAFKIIGVKTEIDLRAAEMSYVKKSVLGDDVAFYNIQMPSTDVNILTAYPEEIRQIFEIFADKNNYPIIFHCSGGVDRGGLVAFLLEGLLGLDEETLMRDYLFSNFATVGTFRTGGTAQGYLDIIKSTEGNTLQEQFFNYLKGIGLTDDQLWNIIYIMRTRPAA